ncbi:MAG: hypothetical protein NW226_09310 [Microscillaceae bacterium]|nr:hypothetical protein [Microscillaceae bacterium]
MKKYWVFVLIKCLQKSANKIRVFGILAWERLESTDAYKASFPTTASQINQQNLATTLKNSSSKNCNYTLW